MKPQTWPFERFVRFTWQIVALGISFFFWSFLAYLFGMLLVQLSVSP